MSKIIRALALSCIFVACVSLKSNDTSTNADEAADSNSNQGNNNNNNNNDNDNNNSDDTDAGIPAEDCTQSGDFVACATCFAQQNPTGASAYDTAVMENCVCANECIVECEAACEDPSAMDESCNTCVNTVGADQNSQCFTGFASDCGASQDCVTYSQQLASCPQ